MTAAPLIPYLTLPELSVVPQDLLGHGLPPQPFTIKPFGTLVAIGVYVGAWLAVRQARRVGLDEKTLVSFMFWVVGTGFVLAHVLDTALYYPARALEDPLSLVRLWDGLSSFGGFIGAAVGAFAWKVRHKVAILPYADVVASTFPAGWVFGRTGCTLAHDHPGMHSDLWFAVRYPGGGRFDLGLYEMLLTVPLALAFLHFRRGPRPWGFYLGAMGLAYAPSRFVLDFLRAQDVAASDARYAGLTPAQWACFGLLAMGVFFLWRALDSAGTLEAVAPPTAPPRAFAAKNATPGS